MPPSLEGVAIAYLHLLSGHAGRDRLQRFVAKEYFIPKGREKVAELAHSCQSCLVTNPATGRKLRYGLYPCPETPYSIMFADYLEKIPANSAGIKYILVFVCYLSKAVFLFPLKALSSENFINAFKTLYQFVNGRVNVLVCDNATTFRSERTLAFLATLNVNVPRTKSYSSYSRGVVERSLSSIQLLLRKLLVNSPNYDASDLIFLVSLLLNNTVTSTTKVTPMEMIYGRTNSAFSPIGEGLLRQEVKYPLLSEDVKRQVRKTRAVIAERVRAGREELLKYQRKMLAKANRFRKDTLGFKANDIVFVKRERPTDVGVSQKFVTKFYKSPFLVLEYDEVRFPYSVYIMRISDKVVMRVSPNRLRKFREKDPELFREIPTEVLQVLGKPLTEAELRRLAYADTLEVIYRDKFVEEIPTSARLTRAQAAKQRELLEQALLEDEDGDGVSDDEEDEPVAGPSGLQQRLVSFNPVDQVQLITPRPDTVQSTQSLP